jgi:hypothetical protein
MESTKVETTETSALNKADVISWPDSVRLKMIEKSEFYGEPRIYQYGYYDGYQKRNDQIKKAIEIIQKVREGYLNPDAMLQNAILELLK